MSHLRHLSLSLVLFTLSCAGAGTTNENNSTNNCNNVCALGESRCSGVFIETCQEDTMGCLAFAEDTNCSDSGQLCQVVDEVASCVESCTDQCTAGSSSCSGDVIQTCQTGASGCLELQAGTDCAGLGQLCQVVGEVASCVESCTDQCTAGSSTCSGDVIQTCQTGSSGCLELQAETDCAGLGQLCQVVGEVASCVESCTDQCTAGSSTCSGDVIQTCQTGASGCLELQPDEDCSSTGRSCAEQAGVAQCACNDACGMGDEQCSGDVSQACTQDTNGCYGWGDVEDCSLSGQSCVFSAGSASCTTGGGGVVFSEDFSSWTGGAPTGWSVVDGADIGYTWVQCTTCTQISDFTLGDGGTAFIDSDDFLTFEDELISPSINLSSYTSVTLEYDYTFVSYTDDFGRVDISTDGGSTWTQNVALYDTSLYNQHESLNISALAAGHSDVKIRFFYSAYFDYHWFIDNLVVTAN